MTPVAKKIFVDATSGNVCTDKTPGKISRTGVNGTTPENIVNAYAIRKSYSPAFIEIIETTSPPYGLNASQEIGNKRKSTSQDRRNFNKLDTSIDGKFTDNLVAPPILTEVNSEKLSHSSSQDLYTLCRTNLAADTVNIPAPQFVNFGLSTINTLDRIASLWNPATIVGNPTDVAHGSAPDRIFEKLQWLETMLAQSQTITIKLILKFGGKIRNFSAKIMQGADHF